uniref:Uncharacterized protein n=1 Tax=Oryza glumipatula TaxID=40148 RepID=A0A0E0ARW0_9ORYZ
MRGRGHGHAGAGLRGMAQAAVRRSKGQCEAFRSQHAVDDGFLLFLGETGYIFPISLFCLYSKSSVLHLH